MNSENLKTNEYQLTFSAHVPLTRDRPNDKIALWLGKTICSTCIVRTSKTLQCQLQALSLSDYNWANEHKSVK